MSGRVMTKSSRARRTGITRAVHEQITFTLFLQKITRCLPQLCVEYCIQLWIEFMINREEISQEIMW
jgi:hypothetical protein